MRKIGVYGGTFDPIHHAHLILARDALEMVALEQVIFVPAAVSPHKLNSTAAPAEARLEMLRAAVESETRFAVDESELRRPPPSFTVDTIESFAAAHPEAEIYYLLGSDNLPGLPAWHRFDDLRKLVKFVVLSRGPATAENGHITVQRELDISATDIRNRVASGRSIRYLVPPPVEEIIRRHHLYQEPSRSVQKS